MSDNEQPVAARASIARTSQACQRCRSLKTRCLPSSQAGTCQRCLTGGRNCVWAEAPRRARKLRAPSRISQVEQKIDGLVASLVNPSATQPTADSTPSSASAASLHDRPQAFSGSFAHGVSRERRPVAPGNWLPIPSSFEPRLEASGTLAERSEEDADVTDRQYIEQIRSIHSFDGPDEDVQRPEGLFRASKRREDPIKDDLIDGLLASGEADALIHQYRKMSESFPFVLLVSGITAHQLCQNKPMLFLAMITAASWGEHKRQMSLDALYRQELANRTIIRPRKNLGLVQSVLVYLSWYHFVFSHKTQQIFFLHHLVVGLALDIGLHRDFQPVFFPGPRVKKAPELEPTEKRERQRTFLGCYYLASMVSAALQKPNLLKHSSDMNEWAQELRQHGEYATDEVLGHLVSLRQLDDQVQDSLFTGTAADARLTDVRVVMHVRFLKTQLDAWKRDAEGVQCQRMLILSHSYTDMLLHSIALRPSPESAPPASTDSTHVTELLSTLEAAKCFFDTLLSFPASDYHLISFSEWMRLPSAMMTVAKLCIPSNAHVAVGWDVKTAQDIVRLEICLEALCYRFQNQSTYDKTTQPHHDFWWAMRVVTDLTRMWYIRRITPEPQNDTSTRPTPCSNAVVNNLCPNSGALPTPPDARLQDVFADFADVDFSSLDTGFGAGDDGSYDPLSFMKSVDFDMEQIFDAGIWGDEVYHGMGFGGGMPF